MKKKLLSIVLSAALALALVPSAAFAAENGVSVDGENIEIANGDLIIYCQGTVTENVNVKIDYHGFTPTETGLLMEGDKTYDGPVTVIALKSGSSIYGKRADDGHWYGASGDVLTWDAEQNMYVDPYRTTDKPYLYSEDTDGLTVEESFGLQTDIEYGFSYQADAYMEQCGDTIILFVLDNVPDALKSSTATNTPATPGTYTAVQYDTWGQIALNNYGTYGVWKQLYKANNYVKLKKGTIVTLPETLGSYTRIEAPVAGEGEKLYTVQAGDTLGKIALATYGDMSKYKDIFERNSDRLKNANTIYEGQVIVLPAAAPVETVEEGLGGV